MKTTFTLKTDLALAYFPHLTATSARNKLMSLINDAHSTLRAQLVGVGYADKQKEFTPAQVTIITDYLGNPFK